MSSSGVVAKDDDEDGGDVTNNAAYGSSSGVCTVVSVLCGHHRTDRRHYLECSRAVRYLAQR
jgi:hypothetical protein